MFSPTLQSFRKKEKIESEPWRMGMVFETREQILEKILTQEKPKCPHCKQEMSIWEVPPIQVGDGLGWGTPYLFICFNDECPLYEKGWDNMRENYGRNASYRCMCYPDSDKESFECLPVFSPMGATGQIIDDQIVSEREALKEATKKGFMVLAESFRSKDWKTVLALLLDGSQPEQVRRKAAEMIGDIGEIDAIDPVRNQKFGSEVLRRHVDDALRKMHERFFTRECPFCAEIIKKRAKICKHCGSDVTGG